MRRRDCSLRHSPNGDFPSWAQRAGWVQLPRPNSLVHGWDEGGARLPRPQVFCRLIDPTEASPRRRTKTETIILSSSTPLLLHPTTTNRPRPPRQPSIRPAPVPLPSRSRPDRNVSTSTRQRRLFPSRHAKMGWSKSTRIKVMIVLDTVFFFLELGAGFAVHSLALLADAFHMVSAGARPTQPFPLFPARTNRSAAPLRALAQRHHLARRRSVGCLGGEEGKHG